MLSFIRKMRNCRTSSSCSSSSVTRASFSNPGQQDQSHALSELEHKPESSYWHDTFPPKANTGVRHSECSAAILESRRIALIPTSTFPHPTATTGPDMFVDQQKYIGRRLPPRTEVQGCGKHKEIVVIHTEFNNEMRGLRKSTETPSISFDSRHVTRADLPFATIGVFHVHPNITRNPESCPSSPSTNAMRLQVMRTSPPIPTASFNVYNPDQGLINYIIQKYQKTCFNRTSSPLHEDWIRTRMTFVFGWRKTDIQQQFRKSGLNI